jgi:hypothetical protein
MNQRLVHDVAVAMTHAILDGPLMPLRGEEKQAIYDRVYDICRAGIEAFCIQQDRLQHRLNPLSN